MPAEHPPPQPTTPGTVDPTPRRPVRSERPWRRTVARVLRRDHGICHLCHRGGADTADHLVPVSKGGAMFDLDNLAAAHHDPCNRLRGDRPIELARAELLHTSGDDASDYTWVW